MLNEKNKPRKTLLGSEKSQQNGPLPRQACPFALPGLSLYPPNLDENGTVCASPGDSELHAWVQHGRVNQQRGSRLLGLGGPSLGPGSWCSSGTSVTTSTRCSPTWSSPFSLHKHLCTFISAASKFAQLQYLWRTADSGAVSALTWSLASYTCAARIVTTLMTTSDLTMLTRFVIMLALNIWITATVLRYRVTVEKAE
ncbi:solute carrier family 66 member 3 isoform X2 [Manis pentadactyla]|uniref:solute carrier family 66 member 3 isoform X2 n=1 Tax=Manis pentadactyla TaxID=143292 RepID=UPI00255CCC71|nr:solute carrier family 66 member 3 isoform X2 [Manis pentadactyla]